MAPLNGKADLRARFLCGKIKFFQYFGAGVEKYSRRVYIMHYRPAI